MINVIASIAVFGDPAKEAVLLRKLSTDGVLGEFKVEFADAVGRMVSPLVRVQAGAMRIEVRVEETTQ